MTTDLTSTFTSLVKTLRSRNKALGDVDEPRIPRQIPREESNFKRRAKDVVHSITQTKNFLRQNRKDYIDQDFIIYKTSKMSDIERQQIDMETTKFILKCKRIIESLRKELDLSVSYKPQQKEHLFAVMTIIEEYLKIHVSDFWSVQKTARKRRTAKMKILGSLTGGQSPRVMPAEGLKIITDDSEDASRVAKDESDEGFEERNSSAFYQNEDEQKSLDELRSVTFDSDDFQALQEENTRLYDELNSMTEQVRLIEGKVVEISELQKQFAEKVIEQGEEVERINTTMIHATENVKDANGQLREAMQNSAGLRVAVLFFLIVLSFSLLFLDWYNP